MERKKSGAFKKRSNLMVVVVEVRLSTTASKYTLYCFVNEMQSLGKVVHECSS